MEEWRPLPSDPRYSISSLGRVRGARGRLLSLRLDDNGYQETWVGCKRRTNVHRLVLEAFVGPCPSGLIACHINDVRTDNRLENLRWGTYQDNSNDRVRNGNARGPRGQRAGNTTLTNEDAVAIYRSKDPSADLARLYGVAVGAVQRIRGGRRWAWITVDAV